MGIVGEIAGAAIRSSGIGHDIYIFTFWGLYYVPWLFCLFISFCFVPSSLYINAYFYLGPKTRLVGIVDGLLLPLAHVLSNLPMLLSHSHCTLSVGSDR